MRRLVADPSEIDRVLADGAGRAAAVADPIVEETKRLVGFWRAVSKVARDVTRRNLIAEELRVTHEKLRQMLAHSPAVIYMLKMEGQTIAPAVVSDNIERMLGFTVEALVKRRSYSATRLE